MISESLKHSWNDSYPTLGGSLFCISPISWRTLSHLSVTKAFQLFAIPGSWDGFCFYECDANNCMWRVVHNGLTGAVMTGQNWLLPSPVTLVEISSVPVSVFPTVCSEKEKKSCVWVRNVGTCVVFKYTSAVLRRFQHLFNRDHD